VQEGNESSVLSRGAEWRYIPRVPEARVALAESVTRSVTSWRTLVADVQDSCAIVARPGPNARLAEASPTFCTRRPKRRSRRWFTESGVRQRGMKQDEPEEPDPATTKSVRSEDCR
jgi:hypothetical protein